MSENLKIYNEVREVPKEAKKNIGGGRLKGMTDINPMWRIKALTEQFGPCGIGWKYEITEKILEHGANDEISAFVDINLFYKYEDVWSEAIPGTGGSSFVAKEKNGLYVSDECFKMALTDALSVACKALGVGANVYWDKDETKYTTKESGLVFILATTRQLYSDLRGKLGQENLDAAIKMNINAVTKIMKSGDESKITELHDVLTDVEA